MDKYNESACLLLDYWTAFAWQSNIKTEFSLKQCVISRGIKLGGENCLMLLLVSIMPIKITPHVTEEIGAAVPLSLPSLEHRHKSIRGRTSARTHTRARARAHRYFCLLTFTANTFQTSHSPLQQRRYVECAQQCTQCWWVWVGGGWESWKNGCLAETAQSITSPHSCRQEVAKRKKLCPGRVEFHEGLWCSWNGVCRKAELTVATRGDSTSVST